jgi:hypothetical protein
MVLALRNRNAETGSTESSNYARHGNNHPRGALGFDADDAHIL